MKEPILQAFWERWTTQIWPEQEGVPLFPKPCRVTGSNSRLSLWSQCTSLNIFLMPFLQYYETVQGNFKPISQLMLPQQMPAIRKRGHLRHVTWPTLIRDPIHSLFPSTLSFGQAYTTDTPYTSQNIFLQDEIAIKTTRSLSCIPFLSHENLPWKKPALAWSILASTILYWYPWTLLLGHHAYLDCARLLPQSFSLFPFIWTIIFSHKHFL